MVISSSAYLLAVVEIDKSKRIRCQAKGCGHAVYARIHVVLDSGQFVVLGGDCFLRLYGSTLRGAKSYYGGTANAPTTLSDEMRLLLDSNTSEFVERLEQRREQMEMEAESRRHSLSKHVMVREQETPKVFNSAIAIAEDSAQAVYGGYRYVWSATWWISSEKLLADVRAILSNSPYIDVVYRGVVGMVRQPEITPVAFATQLERDGAPSDAILDCLHALRLVVRSKVRGGDRMDSHTRLMRMREALGIEK
jgi:hypothetical protein